MFKTLIAVVEDGLGCVRMRERGKCFIHSDCPFVLKFGHESGFIPGCPASIQTVWYIEENTDAVL